MAYIKKNKYKIFLSLILSLAVFLYFWASWREGWSNIYYATGLKSMMENWRNFFFASYDTAGFVSIDKPALGLWIQSISVFIFGFHGWSLILPQAIFSVLSVWILYIMLKKPFGEDIALIASLILAITPVFTVVSRTNNLDSTLIFNVLLACFFLLKALNKNKFRYMLLSVFFIGLGFNIKMIQAFMILPSIYLCYWFFTNDTVKKRLINIIVSAAVLLIVSFSWCIAVDLVPDDSRPYVGGSKDNSALELALGYNGLNRLLPGKMNNKPDNMMSEEIQDKLPEKKTDNNQDLTPNRLPDGNPNRNSNITPDDAHHEFPSHMQPPGNNESTGFLRLLGDEYGGQIGWLLILGLLSIISIGINWRNISDNRQKKTYLSFIWFCIYHNIFIFLFWWNNTQLLHSYFSSFSCSYLCSRKF
jgi:4-amino-4-deoxy-L-arabinose transferase-like glycosyltransferase